MLPPPPTPTEIQLRHRITHAAAQRGFVAAGAAPAEPLPQWRIAQVRRWTDSGRAAGMDYLQRHLALRADPRALVPGVRTVLSFALPYDPAPAFAPTALRLARYALGSDYHDVVRDRLRSLLADLGFDAAHEGRIFCDTAPVDERYWAWRCGLGAWLRSGMIAVPGCGTFVFLGEWFSPLSAEELLRRLPAEEPGEGTPVPAPARSVADSCLACGRCVEACPGGALTDGGLDARRCLSYLTIEHRGPLPPDTGRRMGQTLYGCDRCAEVCPHNAPLLSGHIAHPIPPELQPRPELLRRTPAEWQQLTPETYRALFRGSAVKRAKYDGITRNISALAEAREETPGASPKC